MSENCTKNRISARIEILEQDRVSDRSQTRQQGDGAEVVDSTNGSYPEANTNNRQPLRWGRWLGNKDHNIISTILMDLLRRVRSRFIG